MVQEDGYSKLGKATNSLKEFLKDEDATYIPGSNLPDHPEKASLKGRPLAGYSLQDFEVSWIYQRVVNRFMQLISKGFYGGHPWSQVAVEAGRIEQVVPSGIVIVIFAVLGPVLFPIVFAVATVSLTAGAVIVVPLIRSYITVIVDPSSHHQVQGSKAGEPRYSYKSILQTLAMCVWYCLLSAFPWYYYSLHRADGTKTEQDMWKKLCITDLNCKDYRFHLPPVVVCAGPLACMIAGFRFVRAISVSSCEYAIERQCLRLERDEKYGAPVREIIRKMTDPKDKLSYFPIFIRPEDDEKTGRKLTVVAHFRLFIFAAIHAALPFVWMTVVHGNQDWSSVFDVDWETKVLVIIGFLAPLSEIHHFLVDFRDAIGEFEDVTMELLIYIFISSPKGGKRRTLMKRRFERAVMKNDRWRATLQSDPEDEWQKLEDGDKRFESGKFDASHESPRAREARDLQARSMPQPQPQVERQKTKEQTEAMDELSHLREFQVALNFRRVEGIRLFGHLRKWLNADILNERLEVEHFVSMSLQAIFLGFLKLVWSYCETGGRVSAIWLLIPYDACILLYYSFRALTLCVNANEYLFDETEILLLEWQEHCTHWDDPESSFLDTLPGGNDTSPQTRDPAIAWTWDTQNNEPKPVKFDFSLRQITDSTPKDMFDALGVLIKRCSVLETRQRIMGVAVTKELRNRLFTTIASVLAALIVKLPHLIKSGALSTELKVE